MSIARSYTSFSTSQITHIFRTAKRALRHPHLDVLLTPQLYDHGRILVIASRKTGNAVERNTVKRRIKNIFLQEALYGRGLDCIVIIKKDAIGITFDELKTLLVTAYANMAENPS